MENVLVDNIFVELALALLAGALLGVFFFAGLWWTVRQLKSTQHVALLFIASLLFR
ncbi:MAG TPA: ATP synthase subunit I, partial [Shewanella frigidimarina]|nr:ATP synthase subunit I [Shewanella frigidimarina]